MSTIGSRSPKRINSVYFAWGSMGDGAIFFAWKKWVWALAYFTALLILIFVIAPISDNWGPASAPLFGWRVFFILFALVAVGIWALFRLRSGGAQEQGEKSQE